MRLRHIKGCEEFIDSSLYCFSENESKENKGEWNRIFSNDNPIHIEIGMGKGQFLRQSAQRYPKINFLGIERYQSVLMKAIQRRQKEEEKTGELKNLYFICMDAQKLKDVFQEKEIDRIYLNFSDPWPKAKHATRRLTALRFMKMYADILDGKGDLELKTDNADFFSYSLDSISKAGWEIVFQDSDLHAKGNIEENIMSEYEEKFSARGQKICKLVAKPPIR